MDPILVLDGAADGWPVVGVTPAIEDLTGYAAEELRGRTWPPLWDGSEAVALARLAAGVRERLTVSAQLPTLRRHADPLQTVVRVAPLAGAGLVVVCVIATVDAELARLAYTDALTGVRNRLALDRDLDVALTRAARTGTATAVLYVDLDGFKDVNDQLGHQAGDAVLREVAVRLRDSVRAHDIVARVGGDEFVIAVTDLEPPARERAMAVAEHVQARLGEPVSTPAGAATIGGSVGIALHHPQDPAADPERLLASADAAMYRDKRRGRPTVDTGSAIASLMGRAREAQQVAGELRETTILLQDQVSERRRARGEPW